MTSKEIFTAIQAAVRDLMNLGVCSIHTNIAAPFADAISAMGICICGGALDMNTMQKWFYLENKENDYKIQK